MIVKMTQGERLVVIETLLQESVVKRINEMAEDVKAIRKDLDADKADLAALKNRGWGIIIGVGMAGGAVGALANKLWSAVFG